MTFACLHCRSEVPARRMYCSHRCKMRAHRRRRAGLTPDAYPSGALRGRVSMTAKTRAEVRVLATDLLLAARK